MSMRAFGSVLPGALLIASLGLACTPRPPTIGETTLDSSPPPPQLVARTSAIERRGLAENGCALLIDAHAIGESWERGENLDVRFDEPYGVAVCGAIYSVLDWAQHPPTTGPFVLGEAVYVAEQPVSPSMILDLAKLRNRPLEVFEDASGTATLEILDGPPVGEYTRWFRHTITLTGEGSPTSVRMLAVVVGNGPAYCVLQAAGTEVLEPRDLVAVAEVASQRLRAYSPPI